jgi:hypothetical protein
MHGQCRGSNAVDGWHTTTKIGTGTGTHIDRLSHPLQPDTQYWMTVSSGDEYPSGISNNELIYGYRYSCWGWPHSHNSSKTVAALTISCRRKERSFPRVVVVFQHTHSQITSRQSLRCGHEPVWRSHLGHSGCLAVKLLTIFAT